DSWQHVTAQDLAPLLKPGENLLALSAQNAQGPAGLLGRLQVTFEGGEPLVIDTDREWKAFQSAPRGWNGPAFDAAAWPAAMEIGTNGDEPWKLVSPVGGAAPSPYLRKAFS